MGCRKLIQLQNQYRGLVAKIRNVQFKTEQDVPLAQTYASGLKDIFLSARVVLPYSKYEDFLSWVDTQEHSLLRGILSAVKGYEQLSGVASSKIASLDTELRWMAATFQRKAELIGRFRSLVEQIETHVLADEFSEGLDLLNTVEDEFGASLWGVQLKIALTYEDAGLEAQKKVVAVIQGVFGRGLLGFVAYHCGVRNEPRTTANRFSQNAGTRIEAHPYFSKEVKRYLRHVLIADLPCTHVGLAGLLRISQSHSIIDQYEEFISVVQRLVNDNEFPSNRTLLENCLLQLVNIDDFRLTKLRIALGIQVVKNDILPRSQTVINLAQQDRSLGALKEFCHSISRSVSPDAWQFIYASWMISEAALKERKETRIYRRCLRFLAAMFTHTNLFDPHDALMKISRNFGMLPFFRSLQVYTELVYSEVPLTDANHWRIGLNSKYLGPEDAQSSSDIRSFSTRFSAQGYFPVVSSFWRIFHGSILPEELESSRYSVPFALGSLFRGDYHSAESVISSEPKVNSTGALNYFLQFVSLEVANETFDKNKTIEIIATNCSEAHFSPITKRIKTSISKFEWQAYAGTSNLILSAVALHHLWRKNQSSRTTSMLRFAVGQYLRQSSATKPSEIDFAKTETSKPVLIYFLCQVCVPDILDVSRAVRGSREVLEERAAICRLLATLDPSRSYKYRYESDDIQHQLTFADGQLIVDSSRIYVDTSQLRRWAKNNLAEEYSRYRDLADVEIENFRAFDELVAEISANPAASLTPFLPESEADVILYKILLKLKEEFLTNPSFGLDFFLSKRIRHQSFIGSIRGPLEFANLVTTRPDEHSPYKPNDIWTNKLAVASSNPRIFLLRAFDKFSEDFDAAMIDAKDRFFQIRSKETPHGLIFLGLTANIVEFVKAMVPLDSSFDDFLNTAEALLWPGLEPSLTVTRTFIENDLKTKLTGFVNELRASVKDTVGNSAEFLAFDAEVGKRSNEVQVKLDESAAWFTRTNIDFAEKSFELAEALEMAHKFALSCLPGFQPDLAFTEIVADTEIGAPSLVLIHDLLLIALQNVKEHSGLKSPKVEISAEASKDRGILRVQIQSDVKLSVQGVAKMKSEEKSVLISEGKSTFRSRQEGGSGFFKLAAVLNQSSKGRLDFGMLDTGKFNLDVQYSLIVRQEGAEQ